MITAWVVALVLSPKPVQMAERALGPPTPITGGRVVEIEVDSRKASLFIPDGWKPRRGRAELWMHFHSAAWFVISEYQRAEVRDPVLVFNLGQGSTVYSTPLAASGRLRPWLELAQRELGAREISKLNVTSFSAGFGAVRNLVGDPEVLAKLGTVILCDSMYGSFDPTKSDRTPLPAHVSVWNPLRDRAIAGKATWIVTCSRIAPPTYCGTFEVAQALVRSVGGEMKSEKPDPAMTQGLAESFTRGRWFVWNYEGTTPEAHMTHARRLAELIVESRK